MSVLFRPENKVNFSKLELAGRTAAEALLTLTFGILVGRLGWSAFGPAGDDLPVSDAANLAVDSAPAGDVPALAMLETSNPFVSASAASPAAEPLPSDLNLRLAGVRAVDGNASASSAIISFADGSQKRFVPGDEVMPGVLLVNVTQSSVHLSRAGELQSLSLLTKSAPLFSGGAPAAPAYAAPSVTVPQTTSPDLLIADTQLQPEFRDGRVSGYRLMPRGNGSFEAAGLEAGDMILRVNGQSIEGLQAEQISASLTGAAQTDLDIVRRGAIVRLQIKSGAYLSQ